MSGGAFEYKQHHIRDIHESIQCELDNQGKEIIFDYWMGKIIMKNIQIRNLITLIEKIYKRFLKKG